jgi:hypothetical protein
VEAEVVLLDAFSGGKPGGLHGGLEAALLLDGHHLLQQLVQEDEIGALVGLGLLGDGLKDLRGAVEVEPSQIVPEPVGDQLFHSPPPCASRS